MFHMSVPYSLDRLTFCPNLSTFNVPQMCSFLTSSFIPTPRETLWFSFLPLQAASPASVPTKIGVVFGVDKVDDLSCVTVFQNVAHTALDATITGQGCAIRDDAIPAIDCQLLRHANVSLLTMRSGSDEPMHNKHINCACNEWQYKLYMQFSVISYVRNLVPTYVRVWLSAYLKCIHKGQGNTFGQKRNPV